MKEIDAHETEVATVQSAGEELVSISSHLPQLVRTTETQLSNLSDSFKSLQTTAMQIKVCLLASLCILLYMHAFVNYVQDQLHSSFSR